MDHHSRSRSGYPDRKHGRTLVGGGVVDGNRARGIRHNIHPDRAPNRWTRKHIIEFSRTSLLDESQGQVDIVSA